ncbi:hypothetical protein Ocin01_04076 [Orchesella cincta]|uniref:Uncharacterized protein n=1 Tax=Orchesella cincta TaxID=48709 RepID=A0A1D2NBI5_ORCCI|nr:hypothetical protein Ocin01_04076 [Orchesella cincta]
MYKLRRLPRKEVGRENIKTSVSTDPATPNRGQNSLAVSSGNWWVWIQTIGREENALGNTLVVTAELRNGCEIVSSERKLSANRDCCYGQDTRLQVQFPILTDTNSPGANLL